MVQYLVLPVVYIENLKCLVTELEVKLGTELMVWAKISLVVVGFPELYQVMLFSLEFFPFFPLLNLLQAIEIYILFQELLHEIPSI